MLVQEITRRNGNKINKYDTFESKRDNDNRLGFFLHFFLLTVIFSTKDDNLMSCYTDSPSSNGT